MNTFVYKTSSFSKHVNTRTNIVSFVATITVQKNVQGLLLTYNNNNNNNNILRAGNVVDT